jgi:ketosteroid isomerase-like protein
MTPRAYAVLTFRNGKVLRYREFYAERAARQAPGLQE